MKASLLDQLAALAADYRSKAAAIDQTLAILREQALVTKQARSQTVLAKAITLDTQRVNGHKVPLQLSDGMQPKHHRAHNGRVIAQRQATAAFLDLFSTTEPRLPDHPRATKNGGMSKLVVHGYLTRAVNGQYLRTAKAFKVSGAQERKGGPGSRPAMQRLLWKFSYTKPRTIASKLPGVVPWLVEAGYLMAKKDGYVRTDREFSLNGSEA